MSTEAQIRANQANSQLSTGPATEEGCAPFCLTPRQRLELFPVRVDELSQTTLIRHDALRSEWTMSMGEKQPLTCHHIGPDEDLLRSFLLTFRKFISKKEPLHIRAIHNLCLRYFTNNELKGHIENCKQGWKRTLKHNGLRLVVNGKQVSPEHLADLWINGHYFHDNPQKAEELNSYLRSPFAGWPRHEFIAFLRAATRVIGGTGHTINVALRDGALDI